MTQYALSLEGVPHDVELRQKTQATNSRKTHTVHGSVSHQIIHTASPEATLHHVVTAASPHPIKSRADNGDYYMIAYVSIPFEWVPLLTPDILELWDVSFIGPTGQIQALPPALSQIKDVIDSSFYVGFDWLWLTRMDMPEPGVNEPPQPDRPYVVKKLQAFVQTVRDMKESK